MGIFYCLVDLLCICGHDIGYLIPVAIFLIYFLDLCKVVVSNGIKIKNIGNLILLCILLYTYFCILMHLLLIMYNTIYMIKANLIDLYNII